MFNRSAESVGARLTGSRSAACLASETVSDSDDEDDVILSLTEMVRLYYCIYFHLPVPIHRLFCGLAHLVYCRPCTSFHCNIR